MGCEQVGISDEAWASVLRRDRSSDGDFVYVALTTGIYCRPSCAARHPHRRNVIAFETPDAAEQQGFNACRRCHPRSALTPAEECIKAALDYIEQHVDQTITLNTLSQVTGLSPDHLQRTFKRYVGLTPKAFHDAMRLSYLKKLLREGVPVSTAIYRVGYGSNRALYEKANLSLGMTPASYGRGGPGVVIRYATLAAGRRRLLVAKTERGVCTVFIGEDDKELLDALRQELAKATLSRDTKSLLEKAEHAVQACRNESVLLSKLPAESQSCVFQIKIWKALQ